MHLLPQALSRRWRLSFPAPVFRSCFTRAPCVFSPGRPMACQARLQQPNTPWSASQQGVLRRQGWGAPGGWPWSRRRATAADAYPHLAPCSAIAGGATKLTLHPIDVVKKRLQVWACVQLLRACAHARHARVQNTTLGSFCFLTSYCPPFLRPAAGVGLWRPSGTGPVRNATLAHSSAPSSVVAPRSPGAGLVLHSPPSSPFLPQIPEQSSTAV